jgi:hypothetical protein
LVWRRFILATIYSDTDRLDQARAMMENLEPDLKRPVEAPSPTLGALIDYIDFLLAYADLEYRAGNHVKANAELEEALAWLTGDTPTIERNFLFNQRLSQARLLWWEFKRERPFDTFPADDSNNTRPSPVHLSCTDADLEARLAVMKGDLKTAQERYNYLAQRSYNKPSFIRFCQKYSLCTRTW